MVIRETRMGIRGIRVGRQGIGVEMREIKLK